MMKPLRPSNEERRLEELKAYRLIGMPEDDDFDFITSMAAQICNAEISLISLVTDDKQWFLSHHGLDARETSRDYSFCAHAINRPDEVFIVEDARKDDRFRDNPLTAGDPHVIFYAGVPLVTLQGLALGTLCVIDRHPRSIKQSQVQQLKKLARQTLNVFELRRSQFELNEANNQLRKSVELLKNTQQANQLGNWELNIDTGETVWSEMIYHIHEVPLDFDHNEHIGIEFYHPDYRPVIKDCIEKCISNNETFDVQCKLITAKGNRKWVRATGRKLGNTIIGSFQDITPMKDSELKFKGIFNSTFSFIGFLDTNGILLEANDTAVNTAGISREDVIGKPFWDCYWWQISEETKRELKANFQKAVAGQEVAYEVAIWIANKTVSTILFSLKPIFDERGNVIYVIPEGRPVQEIIDVRKRLQSVIEGTNVGTWEWNVQTGATVFNRRWAEIVGYTLEELAPVSIDTWIKLAHPEDLSESGRRLNACFERRAEFYEFEARMKHKEGHWVWVFDRGKVFEWSADGKPVMMYGTHQDISERKKREEALRVSEEAFRGNFENAAIGMALLNQQGGWMRVNRKLCEILAYPEEELLQISFQRMTHPDDLAAELSCFRELINGDRGHYQMEKRFFRKNGQLVYVILVVSVVRNSEGEILYFISQVIDITEKKEQQSELDYQQNLLSALYKLSPIGIALNDYHTGRFLDVNDKLLEPTGYTKDELLKLTYWDITKKEYQSLENLALKEMEAKATYNQFEKEYIRKDGSTYPVSLQGVAIEDSTGKKLIWSFIRDISNEKEAERKLRIAVRNLQGILDASQQVSIITTDPSGIITRFNVGAERMLGYKSEELVGLYTPQRIHLDEEVEKEAHRLSGEHQREITGFEVFVLEAKMNAPVTKEWTYRRKDGTTLPVLLSVNAIVDEDQIIGYLGVATDITSRKLAEENLKSVNGELEAFSYTVAHDLRAPLRSVHGYAEMLIEDYAKVLDEEAKRIIENIKRNASRMARLIDDLLAFSRLGRKALQLTKVSMSALTQDVVFQLSKSVKHSADIRVDRLPDVLGDYNLLHMVMMNLVSNALKYSSKKSTPVIEISCEVNNKDLVFFIKDNGAGFDMRFSNKLFNVFQRLHMEHEFEGTGVGLATVSRIISKHGGKIWAEGKVGSGATFYFTLSDSKRSNNDE